MNQKRQHIIFCFEGSHIVLEFPCIHFIRNIAQHPDNGFLKPVKIQINVNLQRLIGFCAGPVAFEFPPPHHIHHRLGIVNMQAVQYIPVIPFLEFRKINVILAAQPLDLILSKTKKGCQVSGVNHGILVKNVDCRVLPILLDGENPCHVSQIHIILPLEKSTKKIQVFFLDVLAVSGGPEYAVPFVNNKNEPFSGLCIDPSQNTGKAIGIFHGAVPIF